MLNRVEPGVFGAAESADLVISLVGKAEHQGRPVTGPQWNLLHEELKNFSEHLPLLPVIPNKEGVDTFLWVEVSHLSFVTNTLQYLSCSAAGLQL